MTVISTVICFATCDTRMIDNVFRMRSFLSHNGGVRVSLLHTLCAISSGSPPFIKMPFWAPTPVPTITAVGVAKPREQGQAMHNTVMEAWKAKRITASALEMLLS